MLDRACIFVILLHVICMYYYVHVCIEESL